MKTIAALSVALATLAAGPRLAAPQGVQTPIQTSLVFHASNSIAPLLSFEEVQAITESSIRDAIADGLECITREEVNNKLTGQFEDLAEGRPIKFASRLSNRSAHSITELYAVNAVLQYERRPLGGILTVKVELVPAFCGLGSAIRPIATRETAEAFENLEPDDLGKIVSELSHQLGIDYAAK
ncbi:MAG: hypothetical protein ACHQNE_02195 [Candidatus Kapaibacterium sp.]